MWYYVIGEIMRNLLKQLKKSKKIALFSHISPDPDSIGSAMALYYALKIMKKNVYLFCDDENLQRFSFIDAQNLYNQVDLDDSFDLCIGVDVATLDRIGKFKDEFSNAKITMRIDHHKSGDDYAKTNLMKPYSACGILVYEIIKKLKIKINPQIATLLYFAICGDTGGFRFNNTDALTFEICAKLVKLGANIRWLYDEFFEKRTVTSLKLTSKILLDAKINDDFGYVIMKVRKQDYDDFGASESEYVGNLPNLYLNCGYKIACIIKEKSDGIRGSLRSKFEYDCSLIAEKFGGGGHKNASGIGFGLDKSVEEIENLLENEIVEFLKKQPKEES